MAPDNPRKCCLCNSDDMKTINYLNCNSGTLSRDIAYMLPVSFANLLSQVSRRFARLYFPVRINKKFFSRKAVYCRQCHTGYVIPQFVEEELDHYYKEFYWNNREVHDSSQAISKHLPTDENIKFSKSRIDWIRDKGVAISSVIDFGAGDCAAAYVLRTIFGIDDVAIVDKSKRSSDIAEKIGMDYFELLSDAPLVDLIFSAHSIEHVHDLKSVLHQIVSKVKDGGHIFFETPNMADLEAFEGLTLTPHTYMLSERSFARLASLYSCRVVAIETVGPEWRRAHPKIKSDARADLRVLLKKVGVPG